MPSFRVSVCQALDRAEVISFLIEIFEPYNPHARHAFEMMFDHEPSIKPDNFIMARDQAGRLIGLVRIVERQMAIDGVCFDIGGISSVSVLPEWRKQGVCSKLMARAHAEMKKRKKDFAVLYGRRAMDGFYSRYGYCGINQYIDLEIPEMRSVTRGLKAELFHNTNDEKEQIKAFYGKQYLSLSGSIIRTSKVWDYLFAQVQSSHSPFKLFLLSEKRSVAGYCLIKDNKITELSLLKKGFLGFFPLIKGWNIKSLRMSPRHPFFRFCQECGPTTIMTRRIVLNGGYMARVLDEGRLIEKIASVLFAKAQRLRLGEKKFVLLGREISLADGTVKSVSKPQDISFKDRRFLIRYLLGVGSMMDSQIVLINSEKSWISLLWDEGEFFTGDWDEI